MSQSFSIFGCQKQVVFTLSQTGDSTDEPQTKRDNISAVPTEPFVYFFMLNALFSDQSCDSTKNLRLLAREKETFCFAYDVLGSSNCHNGGFAQQHAQTCHLCVPLYFFLGDRLFRICFLITKCQYFIPCLTDILFSGKSSLFSLFSTIPLLRMRPK